MLVGQVREDRDVVRDLPDPLEGEAVRRRLDDGRRVARPPTIARSARCSSGASGVVTWARRVGPQPADLLLGRADQARSGSPAASRAATAMAAVVVFPSVPVTPITPSPRPGSPYHQAADHRERVLAAVDDELDGGTRGRDGPLDDDRGRAGGDGPADEGVAVDVRARDRHEERRPGRPAASRRRSRGPAASARDRRRDGAAQPSRRGQALDEVAERARARRLGGRERRRERRRRLRRARSSGAASRAAATGGRAGRRDVPGGPLRRRAASAWRDRRRTRSWAPESSIHSPAERLLEPEQPVRRLAGQRLAARPADVDAAEVQLRRGPRGAASWSARQRIRPIVPGIGRTGGRRRRRSGRR